MEVWDSGDQTHPVTTGTRSEVKSGDISGDRLTALQMTITMIAPSSS